MLITSGKMRDKVSIAKLDLLNFILDSLLGDITRICFLRFIPNFH